MGNDATYLRVRITWDFPVDGNFPFRGNTWATANCKYHVKVYDYSGGAPLEYLIQHPTNFVYSYVKWGAKCRISVTALDASNNKACVIVERDVTAMAKPGDATEDIGYPNFNTETGCNLEGTFINYPVTFTVDEGWIESRTILTANEWDGTQFEPSALNLIPYFTTAKAVDPTFPELGVTEGQFLAELRVGWTYHQTTTVYYPEGVTQTIEKDFTVANP